MKEEIWGREGERSTSHVRRIRFSGGGSGGGGFGCDPLAPAHRKHENVRTHLILSGSCVCARPSTPLPLPSPQISSFTRRVRLLFLFLSVSLLSSQKRRKKWCACVRLLPINNNQKLIRGRRDNTHTRAHEDAHTEKKGGRGGGGRGTTCC